MSTLLLINSKKTSVNRYADMGPLWCAPFSKLKCGDVNPPLYIFIQYMIENHDLKNQKLFQYPL